MPSAQDTTNRAKADSAAVDGGAFSAPERLPSPLLRAEHCLRPDGIACEACVQACPHDALSVREGDRALPTLDESACRGCCACAGACDAFAPPAVTMEDAAARGLRAAQRGDAIFVVCERLMPQEERPATNTVVVPCLASCAAEFWTRLLCAGTVVSAVCDFDACASCPIGSERAIDRYAGLIESAQEWTGLTVHIAQEAPTQTSLARAYGRNETTGRRELFAKVALDATEAANGTRRAKTSSVLQDFRARQEALRLTVRRSSAGDPALRSFEPEGRRKRIRTPRRTMLFEAAKDSPGSLDALELPTSRTDPALCSGSLACAFACPRGARFASEGKVDVDPELCIGCGACCASCPHGAVVVEKVPLVELLGL